MTTNGITPFRRIECDSTSWHPTRQAHVQGTDCPRILNVSPWGGPHNVYDEKTGAAPQKDISDKPYVIYGKAMEPVIRSQVMLDLPYFDLYYNEFCVLESLSRPWQGCTLDGELTVNTEDNPWDLKVGDKGVLEIKTGSFRRESDLDGWKDGIPQHYYCQVIHQLAVTQYAFAIVAARVKRDAYRDEDAGFPEIRWFYRIVDMRNPQTVEDIRYVNAEEQKFWKCVVEKRRPAIVLKH